MSKKTGGNAKWEPKHDALLAAGMIELIKANKKSFYLLPGIVGEVDGHGNSRTSAKVDAILRGLASAWGVDPAVVKEGKRRMGKRASEPDVKDDKPDIKEEKLRKRVKL